MAASLARELEQENSGALPPSILGTAFRIVFSSGYLPEKPPGLNDEVVELFSGNKLEATDAELALEICPTCSRNKIRDCLCDEPEEERGRDEIEFSTPALKLRDLSPEKRVEILLERGDYDIAVQYLYHAFESADEDMKLVLTDLIEATIDILVHDKTADPHLANALRLLIGDQLVTADADAGPGSNDFALAAPAPAPAPALIAA